jgi:hypothetical protein
MVNKRFKDFRCLKEQFRHTRKQHRIVFAACAHLVQLKLIEEPLPDARRVRSVKNAKLKSVYFFVILFTLFTKTAASWEGHVRHVET